MIDHETGRDEVYSATGDGPIEALTACIKQAIPLEVEFVDFELHSLSGGEQSNGEADVTVRVGDEVYKSSATDRDVLMATAKAFLSACNQAVRATQPAVLPEPARASLA
jgi:2-isopropylmalate synthase